MDLFRDSGGGRRLAQFPAQGILPVSAGKEAQKYYSMPFLLMSWNLCLLWRRSWIPRGLAAGKIRRSESCRPPDSAADLCFFFNRDFRPVDFNNFHGDIMFKKDTVRLSAVALSLNFHRSDRPAGCQCHAFFSDQFFIVFIH